jgi:putative CocE/NonD family hydrolase
MKSRFTVGLLAAFLITIPALASAGFQNELRDHYRKIEYQIQARDGVSLYASVYIPTDKPGKHPIILERTPYHSSPYGPDAYPGGFPGSEKFRNAGYIFAFSDARGTGMSEGKFLMAYPKKPDGAAGIDESTDTYDTVDYLVKHVPDNNGKVGMWGISYPGYFAGVGGIDSHPALKAISPQAPCANWFFGDDVHHNGAFFLQDIFSFLSFFGPPRPKLGEWGKGPSIDDSAPAYDFFLKLGSIANVEPRYYKGGVRFWGDMLAHPNYDQYWKDEELPSKMKGVKCAVLTVGGWYDAEDQWGALNLPGAIERQNPGVTSFRVVGPWFHGGWAGGTGRTLSPIDFESDTSTTFRDDIEFPFFDHFLRGSNVQLPAKATMFETGADKWRKFSEWPPSGLTSVRYYLNKGRTLTQSKPVGAGRDSFVSDPASPTPYVADYENSKGRPLEFPLSDQRFAQKRSDVLTYTAPAFGNNFRVAGPIDVDFWITTTGTDADLVVKVIDVFPDDGSRLAGDEEMVRGDVFRCKFRDSFEKPSPIKPGEPTHVHFRLNDVLHSFLKGHRLMVQVQGSWFPLVDRNPNRFEDIYKAKDSDFTKATISVLHDPMHTTSVGFGTLPN